MKANTLLLILVCLPGTALAKEKKDTPKSVARALKTALTKGDGLASAFERAAALREGHSDKELKPVVKGLARAFKQNKKAVQILALKTLGGLKVAGSYAYVAPLLDLPDKVVGTETRAVRFRAIHTAGVLHEEDAIADLETLLEHPDVAFARASAKALATFSDLEAEKKGKLLDRLLERLKKLERMLKSRDDEVVTYAKGVIEPLNATLEALTGETGPTTVSEWESRLASK